jgi:hypothetical protein
MTAVVSIYTSDLFDVCIRQCSNGKEKFYPEWLHNIHAKRDLFAAIAHWHTGPSISTDRAVAERMTRLDIANNLIKKSLSHSTKVGGILHDFVKVFYWVN